jgi:GcrA cell cycle regulator
MSVKTITWTEEMVSLLKENASQGLSASEIAAILKNQFHLPFTRNAVIGKAHRIKVKVGRHKLIVTKPAPKPVPKPAPKVETVVEAKAPKKPVNKIKFIVPKSTVMHEFKNPKALGIELLFLKEGQCRYPLGDVQKNNLRFCAAPVDYGRSQSYCADCYSIVYCAPNFHKKRAATA